MRGEIEEWDEFFFFWRSQTGKIFTIASIVSIRIIFQPSILYNNISVKQISQISVVSKLTILTTKKFINSLSLGTQRAVVLTRVWLRNHLARVIPSSHDGGKCARARFCLFKVERLWPARKLSDDCGRPTDRRLLLRSSCAGLCGPSFATAKISLASQQRLLCVYSSYYFTNFFLSIYFAPQFVRVKWATRSGKLSGWIIVF